MAEFRLIHMSLFLILGLQFPAAATRQPFLSFAVRAGDEVTLSCESVIDDQHNCDRTTWLFSGSRSTAAVLLIKLGQIGKNAKAKSDRLSVTANCSLVIKKVTVEDAGHYTCRQSRSGKQVEDSVVLLSLINMTEHEDTDKVTLTCSVSTYDHYCRHKVKWLFVGNDVDKDNKDMKTSQSACSASVTFLTSHYIYTSSSNFFKCEVTSGNKVQTFPFRLRPSGEKPGEETITATTDSTTTENSIKTVQTTTAINDASTELQGNLWWLYVIVAVALLALLVIVVKVVRWKRAKGNKSRMDDNVELTSNPAVTQSAPETSQHTADPEDGVPYASISYTRRANSKGRVQSTNDDNKGDSVTYTTVKASSADPSSLYATIT